MTRDSTSLKLPRLSEGARQGELSGRDRKLLRSSAHELKPLVQIGQKGLSEAALAEIVLGLEKHELIKVRLGADREERKREADEVASRTGAAIVGAVGRVLILYLAKPDS